MFPASTYTGSLAIYQLLRSRNAIPPLDRNLPVPEAYVPTDRRLSASWQWPFGSPPRASFWHGRGRIALNGCGGRRAFLGCCCTCAEWTGLLVRKSEGLLLIAAGIVDRISSFRYVLSLGVMQFVQARHSVSNTLLFNYSLFLYSMYMPTE